MSEIELRPEEQYNRYYDVQELLQKNNVTSLDASLFAVGFLAYFVREKFYTIEKLIQMLSQFQNDVWEHQEELCQARMAKKVIK